MPGEHEQDDEMDTAYRRFGKQLKDKVANIDATKDPKLRARVQELDAQAPHRAELFTKAEGTLQRLKDDFQITVQPPKTLPEFVIYILAQGRTKPESGSTVAVADVYTQLREVRDFSEVSFKAFRKALVQLEQKDALKLEEREGTLLVHLRQQFMSDDEAALLDLAARKGGTVTVEQAMVAMQWPQARVRTAFDALLAKKLVVRSASFVEGTRYRVPD
jgi:hypothetical protein